MTHAACAAMVGQLARPWQGQGDTWTANAAYWNLFGLGPS